MTDISAVVKSIAGGSSSAHAYIVEGRSRGGRDSFIKQLSMALECTHHDVSARPCGDCAACRQVAAGSSLDIVHMQMSGKTGYKTEDAASFCERLDMGAYGRHLVGIIDDADSLSEIVQNKLLKTLEEPRRDVIILLGTSNADHLLSTVRSRCNTILLNSADISCEVSDAVKDAASMITSGADFYEFRSAAEKCAKTSEDTMAVIDLAEDMFRERMLSGDMSAEAAAKIELCETARADISRGMDRQKALKRLFLEMK